MDIAPLHQPLTPWQDAPIVIPENQQPMPTAELLQLSAITEQDADNAVETWRERSAKMPEILDAEPT
jgi:hypothetical protein